MLEGDPWGTIQVDLQGMEIHVHHGTEKPIDNLGRVHTRIRTRITISESRRVNMECSERLGDGSSPHERGSTTDTRGSNQGIDTEKQILTDETGRHSVPTVSTETKVGVFYILEFKRMSHVVDQYLLRDRFRGDNQYESLRRVLGIVLQHQEWKVVGG